MLRIFALAIVSCWLLSSLSCAAEDLRIQLNTGNDQTAAFIAAFNHCATAPGTTLKLTPGQYDLAMRTAPPDGNSRPVLIVNNLKGMTLDGQGAEIVCHDFATLFSFVGCRDITIRNLKIDYDPIPFTAGQIVATGKGYADLQIEAHHPLHDGFRVESLLPYDPVRHRMGLLKDDLYQPALEERTKKIGDHLLRVPVTRALFKTGDWVILRHQIYSKNALDFKDCQRATLENVTVFTCPGMALHADGGEDFSLRNFNVTIKPGSGRWFSATADASHFNGVRGKVVLEDCTLEAMGDDGANIHNWYLIVTAVTDPKTIKCVLGKDRAWEPRLPLPGDTLEIGRNPEPLVPAITAKVSQATLDQSGLTTIITLETAPVTPIQVGDVIGDASALPALEVRRCTIRGNRARGVLIQTRNALVEDCLFQDNSGAAIQVTSDARQWWEGMPAGNVTIQNNAIARVNFGMGSRTAAIDIFAENSDGSPSQPVHRLIDIRHNTITDPTGAAIHVGSAEHVTIRDNIFTPGDPRSILIDHSRDIQVTGNSGFADLHTK